MNRKWYHLSTFFTASRHPEDFQSSLRRIRIVSVIGQTENTGKG